ncbi:MAG: type II toxin-antitoxin system Phd/YefM family antitoxin [Blastocatellales bacterium]
MPKIQLDQDIRPLSEFRAKTTTFVQQVRETGRPLVITQNGRSAAVLLDVVEYEKLLERLEVLEDVIKAEKQIDEGKGVSHSEAKKQLMARLKR